MKKNIALLYTTVATQQDADQLAKLTLSHKIAACVNITPHGKSIYLWNDKIEENNEYYLLFKTTTELLDSLELFIIDNHPYDEPAIVKLNAESSESFANYISKSVI
jgi:periplasmic divalent cation tolerance protein